MTHLIPLAALLIFSLTLANRARRQTVMLSSRRRSYELHRPDGGRPL